ncbi:hypothetical protein SUGI_1260320 [Cryptomeria japonica]|uniref:Uncharacterized protein n=1 Tax=Cryptomeria japonica TaxID=3369 RepID=A0AAD3NQA7_CRYJA|nr:hypothetical protein SUGI_1260320 [Cryptomeria japonica]
MESVSCVVAKLLWELCNRVWNLSPSPWKRACDEVPIPSELNNEAASMEDTTEIPSSQRGNEKRREEKAKRGPYKTQKKRGSGNKMKEMENHEQLALLREVIRHNCGE